MSGRVASLVLFAAGAVLLLLVEPAGLRMAAALLLLAAIAWGTYEIASPSFVSGENEEDGS